MLLVQILTCQGINREQMIKRTYITLFISFPLLSILGVFHRSRVLCPPFLSRWFLNITIYLEKFKTKNNFCECQNNICEKTIRPVLLKNFYFEFWMNRSALSTHPSLHNHILSSKVLEIVTFNYWNTNLYYAVVASIHQVPSSYFLQSSA